MGSQKMVGGVGGGSDGGGLQELDALLSMLSDTQRKCGCYQLLRSHTCLS